MKLTSYTKNGILWSDALRKQTVHKVYLFFALLLLSITTSQAQVSILPECINGVPLIYVDLQSNPDDTYISDQITRTGDCCNNAGQERFISFYATLHPNAAMVEIGVAEGADPYGSGSYYFVDDSDLGVQGNCLGPYPAGSPVCIPPGLTGPNYKIIFGKPGNNPNKFFFRQILKPTFPEDDTTRVGCVLPFDIYGLTNTTIQAVASSHPTNPPSNYDGLIDMSDPVHPIFNAPTGTPTWIDYEICGDQEASTACGVYQNCDTVRFYVYPRLTVNIDETDPAFCIGGDITLHTTVNGGDTNYDFAWYQGTDLNNSISTVDTLVVDALGTYIIYVSDGLTDPTYCPAASDDAFVDEGEIPTVEAGPDTMWKCASSPNINLFGYVDGDYANSGVWSTSSDGSFVQPTDELINTYVPSSNDIDNGSVLLILTSTGGSTSCEPGIDTVVVIFSDTIYATPSYTSLICNGDVTTINSNATGGTDPLTYLWSTGNTSSSISNVSAGTYSVTVTDSIGCKITETITVTEPDPIVLSTTSVDESSAGSCDGDAIVFASGGSGSFVYDWYNDGTGDFDDPAAMLDSLCYGVYTVTVQDSYGCEATISTVVSNPSCLSLEATAINTDLTCHGDSDATATASATGGTGGYSYSWNTTPVQNSAVATGLSAGTYTVTVTDAGGCIDVANVTILQPSVITNTMTWTDATSIGGFEGTATANPLGGNPGYTYMWSPAPAAPQTTQTVTGLSEGTYYVDITDANSCVKQDSVMINQPPCNDFTVAVYGKDISCYGLTDGSAFAVVGNGSGYYTYSWSNGDTTVAINGLAAGSYSVTITDTVTDCITFTTFDVVEPAPLTLSLLPNEKSCADGINNGTIDLTVTGGTYPYQFSWSQGTTSFGESEDLINLDAGVYSVQIQDANGCQIDGFAVVTVPDSLIADPQGTDITCNGAGDGSILVSTETTGGVAPYSYYWTGPNGYTSSIGDINGLESGQYILTTTDANGCTHKTDEFINEPEILDTAASYVDSVTCLGDSDGSIDLDITGGTMPYTYSWTGPASFTSTDTLISGLVAGDYTYTVTDARSCTTTGTITVATVVDITNPVITCTVPDQTVTSDGGVCTYTVSGTAWDATATDNCLISTIEYVLTGATTGTGTSLNGVVFNLGTTTVTWTATDNSGNTDVCSYDVTVEDNELPSFTACIGATQTVSSDPGVCTYTNTGTAWDATASDNCSVASITYTLTGATTGTGTTLDGVVFNLGTTTVTWTATDGSGNSDQCIFDVVVEDNELPSFTACIGSTQNVIADPGVCTYTVTSTAWDAIGDDNCTVSAVTATVSGASTAAGLTTLNGFTFNPGTSTVTWTVTDGSGNSDQCIFDVVVADTEDPAFSSCGAAGNQSVVTDAGSCFYTHSGTGWNAIATDNCTVSTVTAALTGATTASGLTTLNNVQFNLGTTTVTWTVTDNSGNSSTCTFDVTVTDNQNPVISSCGAGGTQNVSSDIGTCTYAHTGTGWDAIVTDNCTVASVTYSLSGATTGTGTTLDGVIFNLGTTLVTWTATDNAGNVSTCSFNVNVSDDEAPAIVNCGPGSNQTVSSDAGSCSYTHAGTTWDATVTDNCTVGSVTYNLTGATSGSGTTLDGVTFSLGTTTVTWSAIDGSGNSTTCSFTVTVEDNELPQISCSADIESCDPIVTFPFATATDNCGISGVAQIAGFSSGSAFPVGTTTVTFEATDANGNTNTCSFNVTIHPTPILDLVATDISCNGLTDGSIDLTVSNATAPFIYSWSSGQTTEDVSGLSEGSYTVSVVDDNGCTNSNSASIAEPDALAVTKTIGNISCYGSSDGYIDITVTGGIAPYSYSWSNGPTTEDIVVLTPGIYTVDVTDANGCVITNGTNVIEPDSIEFQYLVTDATCNAANGTINIQATGGTTPYNYAWSNGSTTQNLTNAVSGTYTLTLTDANGCIATLTDSVESTSNISAEVYPEDVSCFGEADGTALAVVQTGNAPYVFTWTNGDSANFADSMAAGSHSVTIADAFGCEITIDFDINQPDSLYVELTSDDIVPGYQVSPFGNDNGSIISYVSGGTPAYEYSWAMGSTDADLYNLTAGTYYLTVTDANRCKASAQITLVEPGTLEIPEGVSPNGDLYNDYFVVRGLEAYPENDITIYNRWGNVVYEQSGYQNDWEGQNNRGEALPDGTYYVILNVYDGNERITLTGYIDLRRTR